MDARIRWLMAVATVVGTLAVAASASAVTPTDAVGVPVVAPTVVGAAMEVVGDYPSLVAQVDGGGAETSVRAECGATTDYGTNVVTESFGVADGTVQTYLSLQTLTVGSTYHCRVKAWNIVGTSYGDDVLFEIPTTAPVIRVQEPVVGDTVTVSGTLDPRGADSTATVSCTNGADTKEAALTKAAGAASPAFVVNLGTMHIGTTYDCTARAQNVIGTSSPWTFQVTLAFRTPDVSMATLAFNGKSLVVKGRVASGGSATSAIAQCGISPGTYTLTSSALAVPAGDSSAAVTATVPGLLYGTTYTCRLRANNELGVGVTPAVTFTTPPALGPFSTQTVKVPRGARLYLRSAIATLSNITTVVFRRVPGRMSGSTCKATGGTGAACVILVRSGKVVVNHRSGQSTWAVPTIYSDHTLQAGVYTARVRTTDPATGKVTGTREIVFRITA